MAITATTYAFPSSVSNGQRVDVQLTISNSSSSPVVINTVQPQIANGYASAMRQFAFPPGASTTIPANGSLSVSWSDVFFANLQSISPEFQFSVGAIVYTADGAVTTATAATVNVTPPQTPTPIQPGTYPYTPTPGPLSAPSTAAPIPGAFPYQPVAGQLRFESSLASSLLVVLGL